MITNFKIFENNTENKYWLVKYDNFLDVKLYKIGMTFDDIKRFSFIHNHQEDVYIGYSFFDSDSTEPYYSYTHIKDENHYIHKGCKYMGEVKLTDEDIKNYEMTKNQEKYNL